MLTPQQAYIKSICTSLNTPKTLKFASEALGTGFSPTRRGTEGYSRVFDLVFWNLESYGMKCLSKDVHIAKFAFSEKDPENHQVRLSWADYDDEKFPGIKVKIQELTPEKWTVKANSKGEYIIKTDSLHAYPADFMNTCYSIWRELRDRTNAGLTYEARYNTAIRFLEHCQPID